MANRMLNFLFFRSIRFYRRTNNLIIISNHVWYSTMCVFIFRFTILFENQIYLYLYPTYMCAVCTIDSWLGNITPTKCMTFELMKSIKYSKDVNDIWCCGEWSPERRESIVWKWYTLAYMQCAVITGWMYNFFFFFFFCSIKNTN